MLVSIIIPTYQPGQYLFQCIQSITAQTLDPKAFEIIIVLNGCNEPYRSQIMTHLKKYERWNTMLLQTDEPGVSNARNRGLDAASGEYICFIDDDDWISPNFLSNLTDTAHGADIVEANVKQINDYTHLQTPHFLTAAYDRNRTKSNPRLWDQRSFLSNACCKIIHKRAIADDRFAPQFPLGEDSLFMFLISRRIRTIRIASPDTIYYVRQHPDSASRSGIRYRKKVQLLLQLTAAYIRIWIRRPGQYNFVFFLTRIAATLQKLFIRNYR